MESSFEIRRGREVSLKIDTRDERVTVWVESREDGGSIDLTLAESEQLIRALSTMNAKLRGNLAWDRFKSMLPIPPYETSLDPDNAAKGG